MGSPPKQAAALRPPRALLLALAFLVGALTVSLMLLGVPARDYALALGASVPAHQRAGCRPVFAATDDGDEAASTLGPEVRVWGARRRVGGGAEHVRTPCGACRRTPPHTHTQTQELALYRRLQAWQFAMPADALRRSMLQQGDPSRLRAAVGRALEGKPLRVFVAGGSVTEGVGSLEREEGHGYVTRFFQFVNATFVPSGGRAHTLTNGGISATNRWGAWQHAASWWLRGGALKHAVPHASSLLLVLLPPPPQRHVRHVRRATFFQGCRRVRAGAGSERPQPDCRLRRVAKE